MTKHLHLKKVLATLLTIVALAAGQQAFATVTETITIKGQKQSNGNISYFAFEIQSIWGGASLPGQQGSSYTFNNTNLPGGMVTLNGTLNFQEATQLTDVVTGSTFTVTVENSEQWFYSATVKTLSGTTVTDCSVTVSDDQNTITVSIPSGKTFGQIILDYVTNEPFNNNNTVIGGIESEYIYTGSPIEPVPTVTYNGTVLTAGTDYTVSYANNNALGTATLTVTGTGQYAGTVSHDYNIRAVALSDFNSLGNNTYEIASTTDLDLLAVYVNLGNNCQGLTFMQTADIAYTYTTAWNNSSSTENNYTAIGTYATPFRGTFDGQNYSISGIRVYKGDTSSQGLFGELNNSTVKRVHLADARITGKNEVGGIAGASFKGTVEDCTVANNVAIHAVANNSFNHGGIVGGNQGTVQRCISHATLSVASNMVGGKRYGGVVGYNFNNGSVKDCLAIGATVPDKEGLGAIAGENNDNSTLQRNFYRNCTVNGTANATNVGCGGTDIITNQGALALYSLTLPDNVTTDRTASAILPGTGNKTYTTGADINGIPYYCQGGTVTLVYNNLPEGYRANYTATGGTINGNILTMPAANVTVTVALVPDWSGRGTQTNPYVITTTAQLDALAAAVKSGETYSGTYFVLGNDIAYSTEGLGDTDENFIPIGGYFNGGDKNFSGTFDGQGHTISGIRLYKNGTAAPSMNQGLFGRISDATIQNVTLTDARITGYRYVGGLVGNKVSGTVQNCLVLESTITCADKYVGALFGKNTGTITTNYYHNCTVNGTANATNVGVGGNGGTSSSSDKNGARSAHTLTLGENVTATGECVNYQNTTYYVSNTNITLGYNNLPAGYTVTYSLNGTALTGNTFTMPANDNAVVSATVTAPTYTKAIAAHHTENGVNYGWYLIASPVGTVNLTDVPHLFDNQYDLYYFDQTGGDNGKEWKNHKAHTNTFTTLESGIGYLYANSGNVTLEFTGVPYSGNGQVTLTKADGFEFSGWNLIGNPFSTAATLDKPFYRMNESGSALSAQIEANNSVAAMEGVFVQASTNNETATFTQVNNSKGGEKKDVPMLNINLSHNQGEVIDNTILRFDGGHTLEKFSFREGSTKIYIPQDGTDYAIATSNGQGEMPVNFKAAENGTYTLTISTTFNSKLSTLNYLHLIDNLMGADVDLLVPNGGDARSCVSTYTFTAKTTDYESRFRLVFSICEDANGDNEAFAFISNGNIIVNGEGTLQIIDILGRQLSSQEIHSTFSIQHSTFPTSGVYVLRLINGDDVRTQKMVIE